MLVAFLLGSAPVAAQSRKLIAVGIGWTVERAERTADWDGSPNWVIFRVPRPEHLGIAWSVGSETDALAVDTGANGSIRMRHVLFGPAYTWRHKRIELTASALAGPLFNRFEAAADAPSGQTVSASHAFAFRPDITLWTDLSERWGVKLSTHYQFARPELTVSAAGAERTLKWNARRFRAQAGFVFGVY
jgi:hypothetical protein